MNKKQRNTQQTESRPPADQAVTPMQKADVELELDRQPLEVLDTVASLNKGEIDVQIATAKRYPRSVSRFLANAQALACHDEQTAEECIYALKRDGKLIEGASARFAEILGACWGNCRVGARVIAEDAEFVTAQGAFLDLENNYAVQYEVKRRIVDKRGRRYSPDMVAVTANAACSIALRNAVLKGVPKAVWKSVYDAVIDVNRGNPNTFKKRLDAMFAHFKDKYGVTADKVLRFLNVRGVEDVTPDHLVTLKGVATALREHETTASEVFNLDDNVVKAPTAKSAAAVPPENAPLQRDERE